MNRGQHNYTDAEKFEALQILEERFDGNISKCQKHLILKDGRQIPKRNLADWRNKKDQIKASVDDLAQKLNVVREDGSSIDLREANRVKLAKHDNSLLDKITNAETLLFDKLIKKLKDDDMTEAAMFKFGDMIKERLSVLYKDDVPSTVNNTQNNFFDATKQEMKALGIIK